MTEIIMRSTPNGGRMPHIFANGVYRPLGMRYSDRPKPAIKTFRSFLAGNPVADLASLEEYSRPITGVPKLNQLQVSDCVSNSTVLSVEKARFIAGMTPQLFSPCGLYALTNDGVDAGSDPRDAIKIVEDVGLFLASDVAPDIYIMAAAIPAAAYTTAARFRGLAALVYQCQTFAELVTADALGYMTTLTINVGNNFGPDPDGVVGFSPGPGNHQIAGGQGYRRLRGQPQLKCDNEWGLGWGDEGSCYVPMVSIAGQLNPLMFAWILFGSDPQDPTNPPV